MGFAEGITAGTRMGLERRQQRQQEMTMKSMNMELDEQGNVQYNKQGHTQQDLKQQQLEASLQAVKASNRQMRSQMSADGITRTIGNIINGDWHNASQEYTKVKDTLSQAKGLDVADIGPINFGDPKDIKQLRELGVNVNAVDNSNNNYDGEIQDALNRSFIKVQGHDGKTRVMPVDGIMKATNTWNMMSTQERDLYTKNANRINSVLKGTGTTSTQEKLQEQGEKLASSKLTVTQAAVDTGDQMEVMKALGITNPEIFVKNLSDPNQRRDALKQLNIAMERADIKPGSSLYKQIHSQFVQAKLEGTGAVREEGDKQDVMTGMELGKELLSGNKTISPKRRVKAEMDLIASDQYKPLKKKKEEFDGAVLNVKAFGRLNDRFQASVKDGTYKSGYFDSVTKWLSQRAPESMRGFTNMSEEQIMKTVGLEGTLGMEVARYLKEMSGTAASENEAARTLEYIIGKPGMQEDIRAKRIKEFTTNLRKRASDQGRSLVKSGFVGDTYDKYKSLQPNTGPGLTRAQKIEAIKNAQKGK